MLLLLLLLLLRLLRLLLLLQPILALLYVCLDARKPSALRRRRHLGGRVLEDRKVRLGIASGLGLMLGVGLG